MERYEQAGLGWAVYELSIRRGDDVCVPDLVFAQARCAVRIRNHDGSITGTLW